jgi:ketosteroid isomerase-like protein
MEMIDQEVLHGHAELAQYVRRFRGTFRDFRFEVRRLVDINDSVLALVREAGRGKGSGIEIERRHGLVYTLRAGKIVRITQYPTDAKALEATGLRE